MSRATIETERLILRSLCLDDLDRLARLHGPDVVPTAYHFTSWHCRYPPHAGVER